MLTLITNQELIDLISMIIAVIIFTIAVKKISSSFWFFISASPPFLTVFIILYILFSVNALFKFIAINTDSFHFKKPYQFIRKMNRYGFSFTTQMQCRARFPLWVSHSNQNKQGLPNDLPDSLR